MFFFFLISGHFAFVLQKVKLHLTQRIENLDGKIDEQREMSKLIKEEVNTEYLLHFTALLPATLCTSFSPFLRNLFFPPLFGGHL